MKFFNEVTPLLKKYIRHYWHVCGKETEGYSENLLLPMDHVDLIITIGNAFAYGNKKKIHPERIHFHGIRTSPLKLIQKGEIQSIGVSFTPWGFYFFGKQSMDQYVNKIVNLSDVNYSLWKELSDHLNQFEGFSEGVKQMEKSLIKHLKAEAREQIECRIIEKFLELDNPNIKDFCETNEISIRKLERMFTKYIGVSPKRFMEVVRFEESSRDVMYNNDSSLTDISYKHGFYDQSHFLKVFKSYTHYTPRNFRTDQPSLKTNMKYDGEED
ncbi:MAG: helix-turn-helix domain-containing protein [Clostridia bacterium]|nr:helix-turn-helix domain-containing protein [Clostridia bacterium]